MKRLPIAAVFISVALIGVNVAHAESLLQEVSRIQLPGVESRIDHLSAEMSSKRLFVAALFGKFGNGASS
jgi:hypothetical protein